MGSRGGSSPASAWLGAEADRAGRIKVGPDLSVPGHPDILRSAIPRFRSLGMANLFPACARSEAGRRLCSLGFASPATPPQTAAAVPLSPPRQPGHDSPQERSCRFRTFQGYRRGGLVALGRGACLLPGRRAQSAFGHARLGLVLLHVRRRSTADHGNRSRSIHIKITEPSVTRESRLLGISEAEDGIRHARTLISRLRFQPLILD